MVHTFSTKLPMGIVAPDFELEDIISGKTISLQHLKSNKATVLMFICNHCPYVKHINETIAKLTNEYISKGIVFAAISSNDAEAFPSDSPIELKKQAIEFGFKFPYLYDATQQVAKAYKAACTPDFFIFDENLKLIYHGQLDDSRPNNNEPKDGKDLRTAINSYLTRNVVVENQQPSSGCNIKWKAGISPF